MKKNELDRLFAEKLSHHEVEVAPEAWETLQSRMQEKKGFVWWMMVGKVAAGLFFVMISIYLVRPIFNKEITPAVAEVRETESEKIQEQVVIKMEKSTSENSTNEYLASAEVEKSSSKKRTEDNSARSNKLNQTPTVVVAQVVDSKSVETKEMSQKESLVADVFEVKSLEPIADIAMTQVESAEPDEEEFKLSITYLQSDKSALAIVDDQFLKSETRLKKIVDMANDIRPSGFSLSRIREFKDDLLALDNIKLNQKKNSK